MTHRRWTAALALVICVLLTGSAAWAEDWQSDRYHLSMQGPNQWEPMDAALIAKANAQVSHVTGRGFIAGFALYDSDTLLFPYLLVQFKPYDAMPEADRPAAQLDERGKLELLYKLIPFGQRGPLPEGIDTPQFIDRFGNPHARLVRLEDDGRFDFAGKIPHETGGDPIRYHTHGLIGKDGVALATVFSIEAFDDLAPVIANELRTLRFDEGFGFAALPEAPPPGEPTDNDDPRTGDNNAATPGSASPGDNTADEAANEATDPTKNKANPPPRPDTATLFWIIGLLVGVLVVAGAIVAIITHQKAKAKRERARARRERLQASRGSASVNGQPTMHPPTRQAPHPRHATHASPPRRER